MHSPQHVADSFKQWLFHNQRPSDLEMFKIALDYFEDRPALWNEVIVQVERLQVEQEAAKNKAKNAYLLYRYQTQKSKNISADNDDKVALFELEGDNDKVCDIDLTAAMDDSCCSSLWSSSSSLMSSTSCTERPRQIQPLVRDVSSTEAFEKWQDVALLDQVIDELRAKRCNFSVRKFLRHIQQKCIREARALQRQDAHERLTEQVRRCSRHEEISGLLLF